MKIPKTITFSGLDGSGKSTIIEIIKKRLQSEGRNITVYAMYDDLSFYALLRKFRDGPSARDNNNSVDLVNNSFFYIIMRSKILKAIVFPLDSLSILYFLLFKTPRDNIVLIDRSSYDYILDIFPNNYSDWLIKLALIFSFKPFLSVFVNTPASTSFERKGEYSVEYLEWRRQGYSKIFKSIDSFIVIDNGSNTADYNARLVKDIITKKV